MVSHRVANEPNHESEVAKIQWFQSLTDEERMEWFCREYERAIQVNPDIVNQKKAFEIPGKVRVLRLEDLEKKKD